MNATDKTDNDSTENIEAAKREKDRIERLHSLMYTLLYPAVLGSMIVVIFAQSMRVEEMVSPLSFEWFFAVFLACYFGSQHVQNTVDLKNYTIPMWWSDLIEIVIMYLMFICLGLIASKFWIFGETRPSALFYPLLFVTFLLPVIARQFNFRSNVRFFDKVFPPGDKYEGERWNTTLSLTAAGVSLLMLIATAVGCYFKNELGFWTDKEVFGLTISGWALCSLFILLYIYFCKVLQIKLAIKWGPRLPQLPLQK